MWVDITGYVFTTSVLSKKTWMLSNWYETRLRVTHILYFSLKVDVNICIFGYYYYMYNILFSLVN